MSQHNLFTSHPHPSVTHGEQIRWTASITWHHTLLLQAFFHGNTIWSTPFHSPVCICQCFCQFGRRCFSTECSCRHSRDWTSVPEGCTKVRSVTREKWRWVPKLLLWANPHFNLPPGITASMYTNTEINPHACHTWGHQEHGAGRDEPKEGRAIPRFQDMQSQHFCGSTIHLNKNTDTHSRGISSNVSFNISRLLVLMEHLGSRHFVFKWGTEIWGSHVPGISSFS